MRGCAQAALCPNPSPLSSRAASATRRASRPCCRTRKRLPSSSPTLWCRVRGCERWCPDSDRLTRCAASAGERTTAGNFAVALKPQHAGKQVEVAREEEEDADSGCCKRAPAEAAK